MLEAGAHVYYQSQRASLGESASGALLIHLLGAGVEADLRQGRRGAVTTQARGLNSSLQLLQS